MTYYSRHIKEVAQYMKIIDLDGRVHTLAKESVDIVHDIKIDTDYGGSVIHAHPPEGKVFVITDTEKGVEIGSKPEGTTE